MQCRHAPPTFKQGEDQMTHSGHAIRQVKIPFGASSSARQGEKLLCILQSLKGLHAQRLSIVAK